MGARTLAVVLLALLASMAAFAQSGRDGETVLFAGVAVTGSAADANSVLRHAQRQLSDGQLRALNEQLQAALSSADLKHLSLEAGSLGALDGSTTSVAFAAALDRELVLIEEIGANHKLLYELAVQLLFFDFREQQLLAAYPLTLQFIDTQSSVPTDREIAQSVHHVLFGNGKASLVPSVIGVLKDVQLPTPAARRLQVRRVVVDDEARSVEPKIAELADIGLVGHEFSKFLSSQLGLALLPHRQGHAIGGAMAARFADGRVFNLTVPEPDYEVDLFVHGFRHRTVTSHRSYTQELFGAFFGVRVFEPMLEKVYLDDRDLRFGATKTMPTSQSAFDSTPAFYETLLRGLDMMAAAVAGQAEEWISRQPDSRRLRDQIQALAELVENCR